MALAFDVGCAGFALGLQRVERLFQALLGGFARVARTGDFTDRASPFHSLSPPAD